MVERLLKLQAEKGQFRKISELSTRLQTERTIKKEIETLSQYYLSKQVSGCSNCYIDAYLELVNLNIEKIKTKTNCQFELIRGKLLRDVVNSDASLNLTQTNISDTLSLYHLKTNPVCRKFFIKLPEDLEAQLATFDIQNREQIYKKEDKTPI